MDGVQAVDLIASWRRILIEGKTEQITSILAAIEARLKSKGFERDAEAEKNTIWQPSKCSAKNVDMELVKDLTLSRF